MVSIIPNKALVTGTVKSISSTVDEKGFYLVGFELLSSEDVNSLPNLARADEGTVIQIKTGLVDCRPGDKINLFVKKAAGQTYFAVD